nr:MAG TPA: hypothetical protein [Caudoviricetes sp.]
MCSKCCIVKVPTVKYNNPCFFEKEFSIGLGFVLQILSCNFYVHYNNIIKMHLQE